MKTYSNRSKRGTNKKRKTRKIRRHKHGGNQSREDRIALHNCAHFAQKIYEGLERGSFIINVAEPKAVVVSPSKVRIRPRSS